MFTRSLLILFPSSFTFIFISLPVPLASTKPSSLMVTSSPQVSFQVDIARPHSNLDLTIMQLIRHVIKRKRFNTPAPNSTPYPNFESLVFQAEEEFIMSLSLGTPPQRFAVIMDTGSVISFGHNACLVILAIINPPLYLTQILHPRSHLFLVLTVYVLAQERKNARQICVNTRPYTGTNLSHEGTLQQILSF